MSVRKIWDEELQTWIYDDTNSSESVDYSFGGEEKLPLKIKSIIAKGELTREECKIMDDFFGDSGDWKKRGVAETMARKKQEEIYRQHHPVLPDPEWW